jgi:hypothetical protein
MIFYLLKYLPIICFIYIGLSRWINTSDKRHLRITAVGIFGVLIFLSQDNSSAVLEFTRLSPVEFYTIFAALDAILVLAAIILVRLEILQNTPS